MNSDYNKIVSFATDYNYVELQKTYSKLLSERMKLDKFFSLYLDKFERKMDQENTNTPIWNLYKKKLKEYADLGKTIKAAEYYLKKTNV
jgi:hypothetical protein